MELLTFLLADDLHEACETGSRCALFGFEHVIISMFLLRNDTRVGSFQEIHVWIHWLRIETLLTFLLPLSLINTDDWGAED